MGDLQRQADEIADLKLRLVAIVDEARAKTAKIASMEVNSAVVTAVTAALMVNGGLCATVCVQDYQSRQNEKISLLQMQLGECRKHLQIAKCVPSAPGPPMLLF